MNQEILSFVVGGKERTKTTMVKIPKPIVQAMELIKQ